MAPEAPPERARWLLLALEAAGEKGLTPVQLQKSLFLLGSRRPQDVAGAAGGFYSFAPYHYGPFDGRVYSDADALTAQGLVYVDESKGRSLRTYHLTPEGVEAARREAERVSADGVQYLRRVVDWALPLSFDQLVRAIYAEYPEMRAQSVFRDAV